MPLASQGCPPPPSPLSLSHLGQKSQPPTGKAVRTEFLWRWSRLGSLSSSWGLCLFHSRDSLFPPTWVPEMSTLAL